MEKKKSLPTRITFEERQEIERLLKLNMSMHQIARQLNRSHTGIRIEIQKNTLEGEYNAVKAQASFAERNELKKQRLSAKPPEEKVDRIREMLKNGMSIHATRIELGISYAYLKKIIQTHNISVNEPTLTERLERLEMQMEILIERIKNL